MIIGDETGTIKLEPSDIDLKCAEKVTDSDNEEALAHEATDESKQSSVGIAGNEESGKNQTRDFTCKPKAIKAQRHGDSALLSYQQIPLYAFNSPKNPTGILPFQPTGKLIIHIVDFIRHTYCSRSLTPQLNAGGAFKTMPASPKDGKPVLSCDSVPMEPDAAKMQNKAENSSSSSQQTPPTIFTFNTMPTSSEFSYNFFGETFSNGLLTFPVI